MSEEAFFDKKNIKFTIDNIFIYVYNVFMSNKTKIDKIKQKRIIFFILILIWMMFVFYFSNQPGDDSASTSSRVAKIITNIIASMQNLSADEKNEMIIFLNPIVRKIAHYLIYTLGGLLIINCVHTYTLEERKKILYSIFVGFLYASTDELHQYFIDGRSAQIADVMLDTLGVVTGVCIFLCAIRVIEKIKGSKKITI